MNISEKAWICNSNIKSNNKLAINDVTTFSGRKNRTYKISESEVKKPRPYQEMTL